MRAGSGPSAAVAGAGCCAASGRAAPGSRAPAQSKGRAASAASGGRGRERRGTSGPRMGEMPGGGPGPASYGRGPRVRFGMSATNLDSQTAALLAALEADATREAALPFVELAARYFAETRSGEGPVA